jgi:hypothetical protein
MKKLLIFLISFIPTLLFCYEWQQIGTANCNINNYVCSIGGGEFVPIQVLSCLWEVHGLNITLVYLFGVR